MKTIPRPKTVRALFGVVTTAVALVLGAPAYSQSTVFQDDFSTATLNAGPFSASVPVGVTSGANVWMASSATVLTAPGGGILAANNTGSSGNSVATYIAPSGTPVQLALGQQITLTMDVALAATPTSPSTLRVALMNTGANRPVYSSAGLLSAGSTSATTNSTTQTYLNWSAYRTDVSMVNESVALWERLVGANTSLISSNVTWNNNSVAASVANPSPVAPTPSTFYTVTFTVARTLQDNVIVKSTLSGGDLAAPITSGEWLDNNVWGGTPAAGTTTAFDSLVINIAGGHSYQFKNVKIATANYVPPLNYASGTYTQNFDTLPSTGTFTFTGNGPYNLSSAAPDGVGATGMPGWTFARYSGTAVVGALFKIDNGGLTSGSIYSYGTTAATDRALGSVASGGVVSRFGVTLVNTSGTTLTQFTLGYTGEQWRNGGNTTPQTLSFSYLVGATDINTGTFTPATALDFISPIATASAGALDGNAAANRTVIAPVTITGLSWAPNQTLTLVWNDVNDAGNDHGLAIDDLSFTASGAPVQVAQTITFAQPADHLTTDAPFALTATASSSLTVTYTVDSGPATVSGNTLTLTGAAGSVVIRASQAGDASYLAAPDVSRTIAVTAPTPPPVFGTQPANQTVFNGQNATFTAASSGSPTFQWQVSTDSGSTWNNVANDSTYGGVTTATLTVTTPALGLSGYRYRAVATNAGGSVNSNAVILTVNPVPGRLVNLSIRNNAGAGQQTLIVGFVTTGGSQNSSLLVRAAGPALVAYGVSGFLLDPQLGVYNGSTLVNSNDDWNSGLATTFASVGAFAWSFASKDAALQLSLAAAPYTAQVTGAGSTTGIAIAEIYDVNTAYSAANPQLVNVAARAQVGTGDNIMIAGFVITGDTSLRVLIRGVGPELANYAVSGVLVDPQLTIYQGSTVVGSNDNWDSALSSTFTQVGAFSLTAASKDSAIVMNLAPGAYTAQVSGVGSTTGVALIEVYAVPAVP